MPLTTLTPSGVPGKPYQFGQPPVAGGAITHLSPGGYPGQTYIFLPKSGPGTPPPPEPEIVYVGELPLASGDFAAGLSAKQRQIIREDEEMVELIVMLVTEDMLR